MSTHNISERLKDLRKARGLSQVEVAEKLTIKRARLNAWENEIAEPSLSMIEDLCDFYNVTINELTGIHADSGGSLESNKLLAALQEAKNEVKSWTHKLDIAKETVFECTKRLEYWNDIVFELDEELKKALLA